MKVDKTDENMKRCICSGCPTFDGCMSKNKESFFCAEGKSSCEFKKHGCICGECPLSSEYLLDKTYYCVIGAAE